MQFAQSSSVTWAELNAKSLELQEMDHVNGLSYIISGSIALVGGIAGANVTSDPLERGIYALFQTIGIASIGYGSYKWKIGDEDRLIYSTLRDSKGYTDQQRLAFIKTYQYKKQELEKNERFIKAFTHGLIAALNFYNASQQKQDGVKNTLYFVGGANLLASLSYTF